MWHKSLQQVWLLGLTVLLGAMFACSTSQRVSGERSGGYYVITESEIAEALQKRPNIQNAFEIIEFLRPRYLRSRTQQTVSRGVVQADAIVYMNGVRFGTTSELNNIPSNQIHEIRYLKSTEATHRYGIGHEGGAILISTR